MARTSENAPINGLFAGFPRLFAGFPRLFAGFPRLFAGFPRLFAGTPRLFATLLVLLTGCGSEGIDDRPNIIIICWDTVRADRLGLYGCALPTTPFVDQWAAEARVFDDCRSVANCTVPAHASWFTGFMPGEHGRSNNDPHLDSRFETLAERLLGAGYETYMFSANPHIVKANNFDQGFDAVEHPWDEKYRQAAIEIARSKTYGGDGSRPRLRAARQGKVPPRDIKDSGTLPRRGLTEWLTKKSGDKPFFAFINVMEAHLPCAPAAAYLERIAAAAGTPVDAGVGFPWADVWCYTLGERDLTDAQLSWARLKYAASVAELDALFEDFLKALEKAGHLENTVVILTSDHGELLGEHHLLDHQYSLHEPLIRVPLVVHGPGRFTPGRDTRPVTNADIFPTVLELAGVDAPAETSDKAASLLCAPEKRVRVAECPAYPTHWFSLVKNLYPAFDPRPYARTLRAVYKDDFKLIAGSDKRFELFDLASDPEELHDLSAAKQDVVDEMRDALLRWTGSFDRVNFGPGPHPEMSPEERRRLEALGYPSGGK